jgi:hypothetical protein
MNKDYEKYFVKPPKNIKELEHFIPFITPLLDKKLISKKELILVLSTTLIQIFVYIISISFHIHKNKQENCECSKTDNEDFLMNYPIYKIIFLIIILNIYYMFYKKKFNNWINDIYPIIVTISMIDILVIYPLWLYLSNQYINRLLISNCECTNSWLRYITHMYTNISITSYTIIVFSMIHAFISLTLAFVIYSRFSNNA